MTSRVIVAIRVAGPPREVFEVFTREIGQWWEPNAMFRFTPRSPGVLSFEGGEGGRFIETLPNGTVFEVGRIKTWLPGEKLVFGWRQATFTKDQDTEVEVRFEAAGEETRITVEHRGWDSVPQQHVARHTMPDMIFLRRHGEWWRILLQQFKERRGGLNPS